MFCSIVRHVRNVTYSVTLNLTHCDHAIVGENRSLV